MPVLSMTHADMESCASSEVTSDPADGGSQGCSGNEVPVVQRNNKRQASPSAGVKETAAVRHDKTVVSSCAADLARASKRWCLSSQSYRPQSCKECCQICP